MKHSITVNWKTGSLWLWYSLSRGAKSVLNRLRIVLFLTEGTVSFFMNTLFINTNVKIFIDGFFGEVTSFFSFI